MRNKRTLLFTAFIACAFCCRVQAQIITTVAGGDSVGLGDGGQATIAELYHPIGVAVDRLGNVYIGDRDNNRIRKINTDGIITTIAGIGTAGYNGDNIMATAANINRPYGVAVDNSGNVYFADAGNYRVRKINAAGIITTITGTGIAGFSGDNGPATLAQISTSCGVAADKSGNIYIVDPGNNRIRKISSSGIITTIGGTGALSNTGDGGLATAAGIYDPYGIAMDATGNIYIGESHGNCVRKIDSFGIISTIAGTGVTGSSGGDGPATAAELHAPVDIAIGGDNNIYICEGLHADIRKVDNAGIITTVAGLGYDGYGGDGGLATAAILSAPTGLAFDIYGGLYVCDFGNERIRYIKYTLLTNQVKAIANDVNIYPNPSEHLFTVNVTSPVSEPIYITVTDMTGRRVRDMQATADKPFSVQLDEPEGVYFLNVFVNTQSLNRKIIIRK